MTDRGITRLLRGIVVAGVLGALTGPTALITTDRATTDLATLMVALPALAAAFGVVTWIAARPQPRNRVVWVLAAFVASVGVYSVGRAVIAATAPEVSLPLDVETQIPADLPSTVAWIEGWTTAVVTLGFFNLLTFGLLLFPDGRLPSRRWRPFAIVLAAGLVALSLSQVVFWYPASTVAPFGPDGLGHRWQVLNLFIVLGPLVSLVGLAVRFRRSDQSTRRQIKWIVWAATILVPASIVGAVTSTPFPTLLGGLTFVAAYGIAITKYRLYDIDVVISRTFVYGSLAVFIGVVYVAVVVGVGALVGSPGEPNTALAIAATALVAVAFQPLRRRLERVANRLVFGRKATPYEVLSDFSRRMAATSDTLLDDAARSLAEGTRVERVAISIAVEGDTVEAAAWPEEFGASSTDIVRFPIEDAGVILGSLDLYLPAPQGLGNDDRRLATELASGMGLALRNQLLTEGLEARVEELRESRRRLVEIQDATRRRLERDLHDGAQQQLVALKVKLGLARAIAEKDEASGTAALLGQLSGEADRAVDSMRDFARGVYPPLLEAEGLGVAIAAHARRVPLSVIVESDGIGRYDRAVEATVYFCVLEALRNSVQRAKASRASVHLAQHNGSVTFEVRDDGVSYETTADEAGARLTKMTDRVDAIAGSLDIVSKPGEGTIIAGTIPVPVEVRR